MKKLRIAHISHAYPYPGGTHAGQFVHELASTLVGLGHQVHAIIPEPKSALTTETDGVQLQFYSARDRVSYGHANDGYIKTPRPAVFFSLVKAFLRLRQVVREQEIDIVHAHWAIPMGFVGSLFRSISSVPLVITTHGRDVYVNPEAGAIVPTLWYARPFLRFALHHADRIIAVSRDCARYAVSAGAPEERVVVIHNGVNLQHFSPSDIGVAEIRERHGIDQESKVILVVGSLMQYKGIDVLINAMPSILEATPSAVTLVVGDGPEREALIALRDSLGLQEQVLFAGRIPNAELVPYENACDVFVLPSRRESFGVAAVEAMACAKPVIGARVGGLQEIIDDSQTGLLVEPDNIEQLRAAIIQVLQQEEWARRLGQNAHLKVKSAFSWSGVARKTEALYKGLLPADET